MTRWLVTGAAGMLGRDMTALLAPAQFGDLGDVDGVTPVVTLAVFVAFYALSRFGVALAENGLNPWVAGLMPDTVVFALGLAQTRQLVHTGVGKRP